MRSRAVLIAAALFQGSVSSACSEPALGPALSPTRIYEVTKPFTDDKGDVALNISGLACMRGNAALSTCLVIDDQGRFAQVARLGDGLLAAGPRLPLVGKAPSRDTVGRPPAPTGCSGGIAKFSDIDGEAVAYAPPFFYVVGSHGCSRHSGKFRSSAFILARIPEAQVAGAASGSAFTIDSSGLQTTYRLSEALAAVPRLRHYFTADLVGANGLNIEGLAVAGRKLFAGLRAPTLDGKAFIVEIDVERLFDRSAPISEKEARVIAVPLGSDRGIRDLALLNDGQLLILSGPAQDVRMPPEIHILNIAEGTSALLATLAELTDFPEAKAEAISVLSQHGDVIDVLVMFDGLQSGGPREYRVSLRKRI